MGKKVRFISEIQKVFDLITNGIVELNKLAYSCEEEEFRHKLLAYVVQYAQLNYQMSIYLIAKLMEAIRDDRDTEDFDKLMKDFE